VDIATSPLRTDRDRSRARVVRPWRAALAWLALAPSTAWTLLRLTGAGNVYPVVQLLAFTAYLLPVAFAAALLAGVLRRWVAFAVALVALLALGGAVLPRAFGGADADPGGPRLRILSANLDAGLADADNLVRLVRQRSVDLLALQEFTPDAQRRLAAAGLDSLLPYAVRYPSDQEPGGSALYSRLPLTDSGYRTLPQGFGDAYAVLRLPDSRAVRVESAHPPSPAGPVTAADWRAGLAALPRLRAWPGPQILVGDFNSTLDHGPLRALVGSGYTDVAAHLGDGLAPTWPYDGRESPPVTIDHVLVAGVRAYAFGTLPDPGSDHRAVYAEVGLPRS
jgi:endonuclease/exonuclease/phosphatase (EEP) superfamily protein YafD